MSGPFEIRIDIKGGSEVAQRFARAGDAVRGAVKGVFLAVGKEIESAARARSPSRKATNQIRAWVTEGAKGTGNITLRVGTSRRFRWIQQFEFGTVGTGGPDAENRATGASQAASTSPRWTGVRPHERRYSGGVQVSKKLILGRKMKLATSGTVRVRAYQRMQAPMPRRPFMHPAFAPVAPTIIPRVEKAIGAALGFDSGGK